MDLINAMGKQIYYAPAWSSYLDRPKQEESSVKIFGFHFIPTQWDNLS